jgi:DNA-binding GntR family transcriptional regulator
VREALRQLQDESLVEVIPHRGAFVTNLTPKMAEELYTLRALIEPYAVRLALDAGAYSEEDLRYLEQLSLRLDEWERSSGDTYETVKMDTEFHYRICAASYHELLLDTLKSLQSLTWLFIFRVQLYQAARISKEPTHHEIFQAIKSGDPRRAEETLREHIQAAGAALLYCMQEAEHAA